MSAIIETRALTRRYRGTTAVDAVDLQIAEHGIHGLLGRNGAGKTTLMSLLTAQEFPSSGEVRLFGEAPLENARVLGRTCFIKESQRYPEDFQARHVFASAQRFFPNWDPEFATRLAEEFRLPLDRRLKKLSRGQLSAVGVIVGLAARAPLTFFDEPYLGLDAVARQLFYDRLLADYIEHPRTVLLSTHLIDEVADLLEHVLVIDEGRIIVDESAETLRGRAVTVVGGAQAVDTFTRGRDVLHLDRLGGLVSATLTGLDAADQRAAGAAGLELGPVSLQQMIVRLTSGSTPDHEEQNR